VDVRRENGEIMPINEHIKEASIELRLQKLEDRESIRQLLIEYGRCLDQRNFAAFSRLFAEKSGEWIGGMGAAKGPEAIRMLMEETIGTDAPMRNFHILTNEAINVDGDQATATSKWIFLIKGETGQPIPVYMGHYVDEIVRENGHWRFLKRKVYADIPSDESMSANATKR
jgi:hypothetical protein